jgi:hypothetical protein
LREIRWFGGLFFDHGINLFQAIKWNKKTKKSRKINTIENENIKLRDISALAKH